MPWKYCFFVLFLFCLFKVKIDILKHERNVDMLWEYPSDQAFNKPVSGPPYVTLLRQNLEIVILYICVQSIQGLPHHTDGDKIICDTKTLRIDCPEGEYIRITHTSYGRFHNEKCIIWDDHYPTGEYFF